ncbi:hypothetical protein EZV62_001470 [Acer yangbiense]|uniref:Uncharacterized protein n=1 Tax=Acer yangbiense TaxID=1000413 RepID=A0A5C7IUD9_9ROSI|nr:hypothetical protein EZV62_001470 [Acer yangbiense]
MRDSSFYPTDSLQRYTLYNFKAGVTCNSLDYALFITDHDQVKYWAAVSSHRCHSLSLCALIIKSSDRAVKLPWENGTVVSILSSPSASSKEGMMMGYGLNYLQRPAPGQHRRSSAKSTVLERSPGCVTARAGGRKGRQWLDQRKEGERLVGEEEGDGGAGGRFRRWFAATLLGFCRSASKDSIYGGFGSCLSQKQVDQSGKKKEMVARAADSSVGLQRRYLGFVDWPLRIQSMVVLPLACHRNSTGQPLRNPQFPSSIRPSLVLTFHTSSEDSLRVEFSLKIHPSSLVFFSTHKS